jgi:hypothetical protein
MADETKESLKSLHGLLCEELIRRIRSGEASPSDLNVARQLLRDNCIDHAAIQGAPILRLAQDLPFDAEVERKFGT